MKPADIVSPLRARLVVVVALALLSACGDDDTSPTAPTASTTLTTPTTEPDPTTTQPPGPELTQECSFEDAGWTITVRYPEEWVANDETETDTGTVPACRIFDPDDAEPPRAHEINAFGVLLGVDAVDFDRAAPSDPHGAEVLDERTTTVAGRDAVRREDRLTEDGIRGPEGARVTTYIVDLDGAVLVARTHELDQLGYERNRDVLDAMMEQLRLRR